MLFVFSLKYSLIRCPHHCFKTPLTAISDRDSDRDPIINSQSSNRTYFLTCSAFLTWFPGHHIFMVSLLPQQLLPLCLLRVLFLFSPKSYCWTLPWLNLQSSFLSPLCTFRLTGPSSLKFLNTMSTAMSHKFIYLA